MSAIQRASTIETYHISAAKGPLGSSVAVTVDLVSVVQSWTITLCSIGCVFPRRAVNSLIHLIALAVFVQCRRWTSEAYHNLVIDDPGARTQSMG